MSSHFSNVGPRRLHRSELAVPATSDKFFHKAAAGVADVVFLDLEDAVAPARKIEARASAIAALGSVDWGRKTMAVRVNALDTAWGVRDVIEVVTQAPRLDLVLLPKASSPADVAFIDTLIGGIERELGRQKRIGIEVLIETTLGVANVEAIAASSPRLEAMIFGVGDYSIELGTCGEQIGASDPRYAVLAGDRAGARWRHPGDQYHFALARMANACRAYGLRAIDGPFANFGDPEAYRASAERGAALGCEGKWAIHPSQIALANEVFSPPARRVAWARDILAEIERANRDGAGAFGRDGVLIDMAVEKIARSVLVRAELVETAAAAS
ncbi:CoA ester lyase [Bosea sp. (in: a-proteobacteria)]|jgi:malyl-CoA/(S)-citramalyl-CoA lyase|uniref:HpcH/HpaI aldolase/citrate lyase family protein n=1 Tax=Bosea sp. (in: a-proteobacteria) TaxID=1871050 RepID=UPI002DDCA0D4|nr:CoA ester lyase [Bosea sp. (in: a-proteobacteria)]HEV2512253.1 CoA ester lyase [Bosea sp. (in: a-proteobacteria)]